MNEAQHEGTHLEPMSRIVNDESIRCVSGSTSQLAVKKVKIFSSISPRHYVHTYGGHADITLNIFTKVEIPSTVE
ncbi:hypothetical protein ACH3XW_43770 [Acanthocheilonema viteae]